MKSMKAIQILETGGPEVMTVREVPLPAPATGQVLIQVAASGVNFIDIYVREGRYANKPPFTPGQAAAGTVVAIGDGVKLVKEGDRVTWCSILGTYAEYAIAPANRVVVIPPATAARYSGALRYSERAATRVGSTEAGSAGLAVRDVSNSAASHRNQGRTGTPRG